MGATRVVISIYYNQKVFFKKKEKRRDVKQRRFKTVRNNRQQRVRMYANTEMSYNYKQQIVVDSGGVTSKWGLQCWSY